MSSPVALLLVEPRDSHRQLALAALYGLTRRIAAVADGKSALLKAEEDPFECIVTATNLPDMSGLELMSSIRMQTVNQEVRIILITDILTEAGLEQAVKAGADDYILRPSSGAELRLRLTPHLRLLEVERRLTERGELLRRVIDAIPAGITLQNPSGRILMINQSAARMLNCDSEVTESSDVRPLPAKSRDSSVSELSRPRPISTQLTVSEFRRRNRAGDERWYTELKRPIPWNAPGLHELTVFLDITEKKLATEALERALGEERRAQAELKEALRQVKELEGIIHLSPVVGVRWKAAPGWPVAFVTENVRNFGYTRSQWLNGGLRFLDIIHPDDKSRIVEEVATFVAEGRDAFTQEYRIIGPGGRDIYIDDRTRVLRDEAGSVQGFHGVLIDITQRKMAEFAQREAERRYKCIEETSQEGIAVLDTASIIRHANEHLAEMLELPRDALTGRPWSAFIQGVSPPPASRDGMGRGSPGRYECRLKRSSGGIAHALVSSTPLFDESGELSSLFLMLTDITRWKEAEAALQDSRTRLAAILDSSEQAYVLLDTDGRVATLNRSARVTSRQLMGEALFEGTSLRLYLPSSLHETLEQRIATALTGVSQQFEFPLIDQKGNERYFSLRYDPVADGSGRIAWISVNGVDITERWAAGELLRREKEKYRQYLEHSPAAAYVVDLKERWVEVNRAACELTGCSPEALMTLPPIELIIPSQRDRVPQWLKSLAQLGRVDGEISLARNDGSTVPVALSVVQLSPHRYLAFALDMRERERLQEQYLHAQKMEAVGRVSAGIAHDFANLLTIIQCTVELMLLDNRNQSELNEILLVVGRAEALTRQLLTFSRRSHANPRVTDLGEVVMGLQRMLERLLGESIDIEVSLESNLFKAFIDVGQLEQVLTNLSINAKDAMPRGGRLKLRLWNETLTETSSTYQSAEGARVGDYVRLSVADTGTGMSPEVKAQAFEPFFTTKSRDKGTGLGLAMAYGVIKQAGGFIRITSSPGNGTTIDIGLPRHEGSEKPQEVRPPEETPRSTRRRHVFLVEDDEDLRHVTRAMLERAGFRVQAVADGEEALSLLSRSHTGYELLLTDVIMPRLSGQQLVQELERRNIVLPTLYMSGYSDSLMTEEGCLPAGVHLLQKPFTSHRLIRAIEEVLSSQETSPVPRDKSP